MVRDVELHTGAAYVIMERRRSLYRRILLGMVSGESRACFVKRSLASNRRPRYFTSLDKGTKAFWNCRGCGIEGRRFVNNMSSVLETFTRSFHLLKYLSS